MRSRSASLVFALAAFLAACQDGQSLNPAASAPDAPSSAIARSGWIYGPDDRPVEVKFAVRDGRGLLEGDIDLGPVERIATTREQLLRGAEAGGPRRGLVTTGPRWLSHKVPYVINPAVSNQQRIHDAIAHIEGTTGKIRFVPRTTEADYVSIIQGTSAGDCRSHVGRIGGAQPLWLGDFCSTPNTIHELTHALGLWHEQSRCDRDTYVEILWANVEPGQEHNFNKYCSGVTQVREYSEYSIMHYPKWAWGVGGQNTIRSKRGLDDVMGNATALSGTDQAAIEYLYPTPALRILGPTRPTAGTTQRWDVVMDNGTPATISWYRDRVYVGSGSYYYGTVPANTSTMELLVEAFDPDGYRATQVRYVYPCPVGQTCS